MKFLFIAPRYHINTHYMAKALKIAGHEIGVITLNQYPIENYEITSPIVLGYSKIFVLINKIFNKDTYRKREGGDKLITNRFEEKYRFPSPLKLFKEIRNSNADILVIKNIESIFSLLSMFYARILKKKVIVLLQIDKYRPKEKSYSIDLVGKLFDAKVVTPILGDARYPNRNNNLYYIPFPVEISDFEKNYFRDNQINIICIGKYQERKGLLLILEVLNRLKNEFDLQLTIIGQRENRFYLQKLTDYIYQNSLNNIVKLEFNLKHGEVMEKYRNHDLFILPSWNEPASVSLIEAMSCKLPVICSDTNGTKCYIKQGENGYIFKSKDTEDLEQKTRSIINDKNKMIKMGAKSFLIAEHDHSYDHFAKEFIKIL